MSRLTGFSETGIISDGGGRQIHIPLLRSLNQEGIDIEEKKVYNQPSLIRGYRGLLGRVSYRFSYQSLVIRLLESSDYQIFKNLIFF